MKPPDLSPPIAVYMDSRVNELRTLVPRALRDYEPEAIHQARVATRRLTAAVRLMQPVLSGAHRKSFEKALKKLRRRLGPLRDLDVILEHLNELPECAKYPAAVSWLSEKLLSRRDDQRKALAGKSAVSKTLAKLGEWWGLHDEVTEVGKALNSLLAESLHLQLDAFAEQADRLTTQSLSPDGERQDPHELRIAGKALRYTLELAVAQNYPLAADVIKSFKKMQESLGEWHDMVVLSESVLRESLDQLLPHHDAALAGQILEISKLTLAKSGKAMAKFSSHWQSAGPELTTTIRKAFPLSKPVDTLAMGVTASGATISIESAPADVTGSKTDRDPLSTDETPPPAVPPTDGPATASA